MIEDLRNLTQIAFFLTIGLVSIFCYIQAKKTLFAPIKVESYKMQLKAMEELLEYFQYKDESDFQRDFDFSKIVHLNSAKLMDRYAGTFFEGKFVIDEAARDKNFAQLTNFIVSESRLRAVDENSHRQPVQEAPPRPEEPSLKLAAWKSIEDFDIGFTSQCAGNMKSVRNLAGSPLLPQDMRDLIGEFERAVMNNLMLLRKVLAEASKLLPEKYSTVDEVANFNPGWIWNNYNSECTNLEPIARSILDKVNLHLKIEVLSEL